MTLNNLALHAQEFGDSAAAEGWLREAIAVSLEAVGSDHPRTAAARINLGQLLSHHPATWDEADTLLMAAIEGLQRSAPGNEDVAVALQNRGRLFQAREQLDSALHHFERAYRADSLAARHGYATVAAGRWADVAVAAGDSLQTRRAVDRAFASARLLPPGPQGRVLDELQDVLFNAGLFEDSEAAARETLELHHGKHHNAYVTKLNELTSGTPDEQKSLEDAGPSQRLAGAPGRGAHVGRRGTGAARRRRRG